MESLESTDSEYNNRSRISCHESALESNLRPENGIKKSFLRKIFSYLTKRVLCTRDLRLAFILPDSSSKSVLHKAGKKLFRAENGRKQRFFEFH